MEILVEALSYLYPVIDIVCAVAIGVAFRGSLGGVLGPIAFGLSATIGIANRLVNYFITTGALDFSTVGGIYGVTNVLGLIAGGLIVAALLTGRTPAAAGATPASSANWAAAPAAGASEPGPVPANLGGFNWGAAGVTPLWLLFHSQIPLGILLIVLNVGFSLLGRFAADSDGGLIVALLTTLVGYAVAIGFGLYGNKIAWKHHKVGTIEELHRKERGWTIAGAIVFALVAVLNVVGIVVLMQVYASY